MPEVELSAGTIEYEDTGGDGPTIVPIHGVGMDGTLWRKVVAGLRDEHRCVVPTLPLGGHRRPMRADADLSLAGQVRLIVELLERLDLEDVTLVMSDWGGPLFALSEAPRERIQRAVVTSCEAFENFPPGLPGRFLVTVCRMPGGLWLGFQQMRFRPLRRLPFTWGWMTKRPVPAEVMDSWFRPLQTSREVRRDLLKYALDVPPDEQLVEWTERLRSFDRPALVVWAAEDRIMPPEHGRRLAELMDAELVEVPDSYTLIPEDQPDALTAEIRRFVSRDPVVAG
ncbi:MAG TPA: alpha/beta hydrolase [Thermoleophilaceae bacterium]|jgi:pimeloyl-ACP methyl ester carboxylesterase